MSKQSCVVKSWNSDLTWGKFRHRRTCCFLLSCGLQVPQSVDQSEDEGFQSASNLTPDSQSEPGVTPDIDLWDAVLTYEASKRRCWEQVGWYVSLCFQMHYPWPHVERCLYGCFKNICEGIRNLEVSVRLVYKMVSVLGAGRNAEGEGLPGFLEAPTVLVTSTSHTFWSEQSRGDCYVLTVRAPRQRCLRAAWQAGWSAPGTGC